MRMGCVLPQVASLTNCLPTFQNIPGGRLEVAGPPVPAGFGRFFFSSFFGGGVADEPSTLKYATMNNGKEN